MRKKDSRNGSTPKFVRAEPKNTGESLPHCTASRSNSAPAPSSSTSSRRVWVSLSPISSGRAGSSSSTSVTAALRAWPASVKCRMRFFSLSYTP